MRKKKESPAVETPPKKQTRVVVQQPETTVEIVPVAAALAPAPTPQQVLDAAERQIAIRKGYMKLIASSVRPEEVLVFGGKDREEVYLPERVCRNILNWTRCRVSFEGPMEEHRYTSPDGEFIEFVQNALVIDPTGFEMSILGNRSTRDDFFGLAGKEHKCPVCKKDAKYDFPWQGAKFKGWFCPDHPRAKPDEIVHYLPLFDVDIASVRKSAITNLWNSAVKAIGLQPSLLDLKDAGMDIAKVQRVEFGSKRREPNESGPATPAQEQKKPATPSAPAGHPAAAPAKPAEAPKQTEETKPSGPERAEIPWSGKIDMVYSRGKDNQPLKSQRGSSYRKVVISGNTYFVFDNKQMPIDDGKVKTPLFELLDQAKAGTAIEFTATESKAKQGQSMWNITKVLRIGNLEWDETGIPVLRRDPPMREPGDEPEQERIPY